MSSDEPLQSCDDRTGHNGKQCNCYMHPVVDSSLVQSQAEMEYEKGLWGVIGRGAPIEAVQAFLTKHGPDQQRAWVNKLDPANYTPLQYAARRRDGSVEIVDLLLRLGANPNTATPETKMTPLMRAAACRHVSIVEMLLKAGARKDSQDHRGLTAWDWVDQNMFAGAAVNKEESVRQALLVMLKVDERKKDEEEKEEES